MKKLLCLLIFLPLLSSIKANASNWKFIWDDTTTTIEIPLGDNLQSYIFTPKATLYRDGIPLEDAEIHYVRTGDWLYLLTDVDTHKEGEYFVWYKATEQKYKPGQCQGYKVLITFKVVDQTKPVILECPSEVTYWIGTPIPDYSALIIATDNSGFCEKETDLSLVNFEIPGEYQAIARAKDRHFITEQSFTILVKDPIGPVVTFLGENKRIILPKGEPPSLISYFKAIDKTDGDVTDSISYPDFSTDEEQSFELEVSFSDKNQNISKIKVWIEIVDQDEIVIELYKSTLLLEFNSNFEEAILNNIKRATHGNINIFDEIKIDSAKLENKVGSYKVFYLYQQQDKFKKIECEVKVLASQAPVLLVENITTKLNEKVNILSYIIAQDPSDEEIDRKVEYDDSLVDYTKPGVYPVRISVTNSSGLSTSETLLVTVFEDTQSKWEQVQPIYYLPIVLGSLGIIGGIVLFLYIKKKRNCKAEENQL